MGEAVRANSIRQRIIGIICQITGSIPTLSGYSGLRTVVDAVATVERVTEIIKVHKWKELATGVVIVEAEMALVIGGEVATGQVALVEQNESQDEQQQSENDSDAAAADVSDPAILV